jgi:hypothetical protein
VSRLDAIKRKKQTRLTKQVSEPISELDLWLSKAGGILFEGRDKYLLEVLGERAKGRDGDGRENDEDLRF